MSIVSLGDKVCTLGYMCIDFFDMYVCLPSDAYTFSYVQFCKIECDSGVNVDSQSWR